MESDADYIVREATADDRPAMRDVTLAAYEEHAGEMPPDIWDIYRQDMTATTMTDDRPDRYVAEMDGEVVGCVLLYPAGTLLELPTDEAASMPTPEVRLLAVRPDARGRGIGRALMEMCVKRAREAGADVLTLHTVNFMKVAMTLYGRMGFVRNPVTDFSPAPGAVIEGYKLPLSGDRPL